LASVLKVGSPPWFFPPLDGKDGNSSPRYRAWYYRMAVPTTSSRVGGASRLEPEYSSIPLQLGPSWFLLLFFLEPLYPPVIEDPMSGLLEGLSISRRDCCNDVAEGSGSPLSSLVRLGYHVDGPVLKYGDLSFNGRSPYREGPQLLLGR